METNVRPRYYRMGERIEQTENFEQAQSALAAAIVGKEELFQIGSDLGFSARTIEECGKIKACKLEDLDEYLFMTLYIPWKGDSSAKARAKIGMFLKKNVIVMYPGNQKGEILLEGFQPTTHGKSMTLERFLISFFDYLLEEDVLFLEKVEETVARMEERVLSGNLDGFQKRMMEIRKKLLYLYSYYEQLEAIGEKLCQNDFGFFEDTHGMAIFRECATRLSSHAQILREYSMQVREIFQEEIDTRQNGIMKILTVVTTIFLPLTLIVGWYGMNFANMPELKWNFGYPLVIVVSIVVVIICIWIFKKKKFL